MNKKAKVNQLHKSDTFHSEEFKKQISKPFKKRSIQTRVSVSSTQDPSLKDSSRKSLKQSADLENMFTGDEYVIKIFIYEV